MKRTIMFIVAVIGIGSIVLSTSLVMQVDAQDSQPVTVEVSSGVMGDVAEGEMCELPGQVVITDAAGVIVGAVDLIDITTAYAEEPIYYGTVSDGLCVHSETVELPDSGFYTFSMGEFYRWTISAADIEENDGTMHIQLSR